MNSGKDWWVGRRFSWSCRCPICASMDVTAQRIINKPRNRTTVRLWCGCGFSYQFERDTIADHDYVDRPFHPVGSWGRRLEELIKFIDDDQEER